MAQVLWTADARDDRASIWDFKAADNRRAADSLDELFDRAVAKLGRFPHLGRAGRQSGTRELFPNENYRIVYQVNGDLVIILAVLHTARQWPPPTE